MSASESPTDVNVRPSDSFPFLYLPPELRLRIYTLAIFPSIPCQPGQKVTVFPKRHREYCHIDLTLLRVSRNVHKEASPLFYDNLCFHMDLLLQLPARSGTGVWERNNPGNTLLPETLLTTTKLVPPFAQPQILRRLRHIEIETSTPTVWYTSNRDGPISNKLTRTGSLLVEILKVLSVDTVSAGSIEKTLALVIRPNPRCSDGRIFRDPTKDASYVQRKDYQARVTLMRDLIEEVRKVRDVTIVNDGVFFGMNTDKEL